MKNRRIVGLAILAALVAASGAAAIDLLRMPTRADYRAIEQNALATRILASEDGSSQSHPATSEAAGREIALRVAGFPNTDRTSPSQAAISDVTQERMIVTILADRLMDDSVSAKETRVEMAVDRGAWEVEWAGERWRCRRALTSTWTTGLCP